MAALAASDRDGLIAWTRRGIELANASADPHTRYWVGPLLNNLGWAYYAAGEYGQALDAFEHALEVADVPQPEPSEELAEDYAALGREDEAREQAELALPLLLEADPSLEGDNARLARLRSLACRST
jgi:tetratricopeptide (TPR) repeat protein